jgi:glycosyltransferase involved in cell wall biosynthesis
MSSKPQLLFLAHTYPYPPDGGVWARTYHVLRLLAQAFDVTALCFERTAPSDGHHAPADEPYPGLEVFASVEMFPLPQLHCRARFVWDHVRSVAARRVYTNYLFDSAAFRARLRQVLGQRRFVLAHLDSLDLGGHLGDITAVPVVCVHHNVESELLARRAGGEKSAARRGYMAFQSRRMREAEAERCERVALNVTVSERDADQLRLIAPKGRYAVVPNGVDTDYYSYSTGGSGQGIVFCGGTNWFPNRDALEWFCDAVLPLIRSTPTPLTVRWVGIATAADQAAYARRYGVELTGWVPDIRPYVREAACFVVPLRVGGGSRLKILDAWAMGKAVVSTSVGCEGLHAVAEENILIADTPGVFAEAVQRVLEDTDLRRRLGEAGRATTEADYSWDVVGARMNRLYLETAGR